MSSSKIAAQRAETHKPEKQDQAWYGVTVVAVFSFFLNLLVLVSPIYSMQVFDRVLPSRSVSTLVFLTLFTTLAILVLGALDALRNQAMNRIARWWDEYTRPKVLAASVTATVQGGRPVSHGLQDLQTVRGFIASSAPIPLFDAPWVPFFLIVLTLLNPWLGVLALVSGVLLFGLAVLNDILSKKSMAGVSDAQLHLNSAAARAIRNADTIQAMGMHRALTDRYLSYNRVIQDALQVSGDRGSIVGGIAKFIRIMAQTGVMGIGAWLVLKNELSSGGMIAASILLGRALAPVEQAIGAWRSLLSAREAHKRIKALVATASQEEDEAVNLRSTRGNVHVENLSYVPPNSTKPIIRGVNFAIEAGTTLTIVGPSAAGKSTMCRLLVGSLKPSAGHVRLDGADLYRWSRDDIGNHLGYLPQEVELFGGTVKENIARLGEVDEQAVTQAALLAGCHDMILRLPKGYETDVGDSGAYLSGGQRQRIGLARAIYRMPSLLVLDEPDSHLDDLGVHALVNAITELKRAGSTIIVVTHRQSLIRPTDKMLLLSAGKVELFGDTQEVRAELQRRLAALDQRREPHADPKVAAMTRGPSGPA